MSNRSNKLKKLYVHSNYMYVKLYSCKDVSDSESDSVSRELLSLSLIAINLSLAAEPLNLNFFLGGLVDLGLLCFGAPFRLTLWC